MSEIALKLIAQNKKTKNPILDLGNCGLTEFPMEVLECTHLEDLNLKTNYWDSELNQLISSSNAGQPNSISVIPSLEVLPKLKKLRIGGFWDEIQSRYNQDSNWALENLAFIQNNPKLQILNFTGCSVSDLIPLMWLTELKALAFSHNQVSDLGPVEQLTKLTSLFFSSNQVFDLGHLQQFNQLTKLYFMENQVSDLGPLQQLTRLTELDFSSNQVSDLGPLQQLTKLTELYFWNNQVSDLGPLQQLTKLTELNFSSNQVSDLGPVQQLNQLNKLYFWNNQVSDLGPLQQLTELTELEFSSNQVSDLRPLQQLTKLTELDFNSNQVSDLEPLKELTRLTALYFSDNQVSDLQPLQQLTNLTELDFSDNQVSDLQPLQQLNQLNKLYFWNNQVSDLGPLQQLNQLTILDFNSNQVSDLRTIKNLILNSDIEIIFTDNPIEYPPLTLLEDREKSTIQLKAYFNLDSTQHATEGTHKKIVPEQRILIIGNGVVGKSHLVEKLIVGELKRKIHSTHGMSYREWKTHLPLKVQKRNPNNAFYRILDFGGQEYFHDIHHLFFTQQTKGLLVYCTKQSPSQPGFNSSVGNIEPNEINLPLEYWLEAIEYFSFQKAKSRQVRFTQSLRSALERRIEFSTINNSLSIEIIDPEKELKPSRREGANEYKKKVGSNETFDVQRKAYSRINRDFKSKIDFLNGLVNTIFSKGLFLDNIIDFLNELENIKENYSIQYGNAIPIELFNISKSIINGSNEILLVQSKIDLPQGKEPIDQRKLIDEFTSIKGYTHVALEIENQRINGFNYALVYKHFFEFDLNNFLFQGYTTQPLRQDIFDMWAEYIKKQSIYYYDKDNIHELKSNIIQEFHINTAEFDGLFENFLETMEDKGEYVVNWINNEPERILTSPYEYIKRFYCILHSDFLEGKKGMFSFEEAEDRFNTTKAEYFMAPDCDKKVQQSITINQLLEIMIEYKVLFKVHLKSGENYVAPQYLPLNPPVGTQLHQQLLNKPTHRYQYSGFIHRSIIQEFFSLHGNKVSRDLNQTSHEEGKTFYWWRNGILLAESEGSTSQKNIVLVEFNQTEGHIQLYPQNGNVFCPLLKSIIDDIDIINIGRKVSKLISADGNHFVPIRELKRQLKAKMSSFVFNNHQFYIRDLLAFLDKQDRPIKIFVSYSSQDRSWVEEFVLQLRAYEREQKVIVWYDRMIDTGSKWDHEIREKLQTSDMMLCFLSPSFLESDYIQSVEMKLARVLEEQRKGEFKLNYVKLYEFNVIDKNINSTHFANDGNPIYHEDKGKRISNISQCLTTIFK
jgi:internalin A